MKSIALAVILFLAILALVFVFLYWLSTIPLAREHKDGRGFQRYSNDEVDKWLHDK